MLFRTLTVFLIPTLLTASPLALTTRDDPACIPTDYLITSYGLDTGASASNPAVHFTFASSFVSPSIIIDPAINGTACYASGATLDSFPNESVCSTGRANVIWDLAARVDQAHFHFTHQWTCNGQSWMSSTNYNIDPLACSTSPDGSIICNSTSQSFVPQNVRQICSSPTCP